ncbi:MAG: hypothetical protein Q9160_006642 [Pyrenula sp. 1 TL-2023]
MSSAIQNVALAGATGNLGPAVLNALLDAKFNVTVLTRQGSKSSVPESVKAVAVDYESIESLEKALQGQDALISTLPIMSQKALVDAAIKAGVKRYIPSEFGTDVLHPRTIDLPVFMPKVQVTQYLEQVAKEGRITYTRVVSGIFLDWCLQMGLFLNWRERKIELVDGGDRPMTATMLPSIGQAVVSVLQHPDETKNRAVYTQTAIVTQNKLLGIFQKVSPGADVEVTHAKSEDFEKVGRAEMEKENPNMFLGPFNLIKRAMYGEGFGAVAPQDKLDNKLLGIHEFSEKDLEKTMAEIVKS